MSRAFVVDTCPSCGQQVNVDMDGAWHACPVCGRGRLRWRPDGVPVGTDPLREHLLSDLVELPRWVAEGVPGAAEMLAEVRARLAVHP